jgi:hypothetical protein
MGVFIDNTGAPVLLISPEKSFCLCFRCLFVCWFGCLFASVLLVSLFVCLFEWRFVIFVLGAKTYLVHLHTEHTANVFSFSLAKFSSESGTVTANLRNYKVVRLRRYGTLDESCS